MLENVRINISSAQMNPQWVLIDSRTLAISMECDVQMPLSQRTNRVNQRLNLEDRPQ